MILLSNIETTNQMVWSKDLTAILFGQPYDAPIERRIVHPDRAVLLRYLGDYQVGPLKVRISMRDGKLYAYGTGQPAPFGMIATSDTDFYFNDVASEIRFVVGADGKVDQFLLKMDGKTIPVNRIAVLPSGN
jgi:hypothetical protein